MFCLHSIDSLHLQVRRPLCISSLLWSMLSNRKLLPNDKGRRIMLYNMCNQVCWRSRINLFQVSSSMARTNAQTESRIRCELCSDGPSSVRSWPATKVDSEYADLGRSLLAGR